MSTIFQGAITVSPDGSTLLVNHSSTAIMGWPQSVAVEWGRMRLFGCSHSKVDGGKMVGVHYKEAGGSLQLLLIND